MSQKRCYSELTHPSMRETIRQHNCYALQLTMLVAEFAQQIATAYENFSKELETVIGTFRKSSNDLKKDREIPSDTPSSIFAAWETLLQETENDAQAHLDVAGLLIKNVYKPLEEIATHKTSQAHKLYQFRDVFEDLIKRSEEHLLELEKEYHNSYKRYSNIMSTSGRETAKSDFYNAHNDYVLQFRASNCLVEKVQDVLPAVLEELEEIHIDTCNTIKVAIESHALVLLTKATERHGRFDDLLKVCHQVNPQLDISYFIRSMSQDSIRLQLLPYEFNSPANINAEVMEHESVRDQLILDRHTESTIRTRRQAVQKEAAELTSYIKQNQDVTQTLVNMCQRNLANHLYAKVYETQEDMCRKRNEIRLANIQLAAVRAQIEVLSPNHNGAVESADQEPKKTHSSASIKGMWKKAVKSLKSNSGEPKPTRLSKKGSLIKRKDSKEGSEGEGAEEEKPAGRGRHQSAQEIDPVYSLLKCAADLPKASRSCTHTHCTGHHARHSSQQGDSACGNTSKNSSPSSSAE